jgi:uncharacterized protein YggE
MEREIIVKGWGQARSMPDRAVIDVLVDAEGDTREQSYSEAVRLAQRVDEVLTNRADAVARALTAVLTVHPRSRWKRGESVRKGWRAARGTTVEVTDFSQLGELLAELTSAGGAVSGPTWRLEESNPAYRDARRTAAEDARRRAEDYAGALGLALGPVAWVSEPGLRGGSEESGRFGAARAAQAGGAAMAREPDEVIDVTPAEMTTTAEVEVGFSLQSNDA